MTTFAAKAAWEQVLSVTVMLLVVLGPVITKAVKRFLETAKTGAAAEGPSIMADAPQPPPVTVVRSVNPGVKRVKSATPEAARKPAKRDAPMSKPAKAIAPAVKSVAPAARRATPPTPAQPRNRWDARSLRRAFIVGEMLGTPASLRP